jgi:hypothetical protein
VTTPVEALARCRAIYEEARQNGLGACLDEVPGLLPLLTDRTVRGQMAKLYAVRAMRQRDYSLAAQYCAKACEDLPDDREARANGITSLLQLNELEAAAALARIGLARDPAAFVFHDGLAEALSRLGQIDEARGHGTLSLVLKDRGASGPVRLLGPLSAFDAGRAARNVIAFSLFGDGERYCRGALENASAARFLYPGWTCRFYVNDSVPPGVLDRLARAGAQVLKVGDLPAAGFGTFWRFLVADDPAVDRFLVRDADSVINTRERVAVDEWLASGRHFHVMRDQVLQSELVLAGLWGGAGGIFPGLLNDIRAFVDDPRFSRGRTADQEFLRDQLWPTIRQSVLTHDSQFAFGERRDFPAVGTLPPGRALGDWVRPS